ncbi:MAG: ArsI/CadI family heavy metal resistance metalloenzyme, partial [Actinomycetota bacterium]
MRLQLALNVRDLDAAVDFYATMFGTPPAKRRPGYANFAISEPPLKLVLFESDQPDTGDDRDFHHLNHLGVEVEEAAQVLAADASLAGGAVETTGVEDAVCCYAEKTETWAESPEGARWEWYVKTGDAEQLDHQSV